MKDLLSGTELAERMGIHLSTLWRWEQERIDLRACRIIPRARRCWSVSRLITAGYLVAQSHQAPTHQVQESDRVLFVG